MYELPHATLPVTVKKQIFSYLTSNSTNIYVTQDTHLANEPIALGDSQAEIDNIQYSAGDPRIVITRENFPPVPTISADSATLPALWWEKPPILWGSVQGTAHGRETLTEGLI